MKKQLVYFVTAIFLLVQALYSCSFAASSSTAIKIAAKKYQVGNYTGCLQDCQDIVSKDPSSAVAYYYMAISYAQSGQKDKAIDAYSTVLTLKPNAMLADYASTGKRCLETPDKCDPTTSGDTASEQDIDKLIAAPNSDGLSDSVKKDLEQKQLDIIKNQINSDKEVDGYDLKKINDASVQTAPTATTNATATAPKQPTKEDIAAAMKVLNEAGINPYNQVGNYQNPQAMQLNMLQAFNNNPVANPNDSNAMLNMIPAMMAQSKTGQGNYSPQVMQAFIMNTLTGNMMNSNSNKDENSSDNY